MNRELSPLHGVLLEITLTVFLKNSKICICSRVSKLNVKFCISGYRAPPDSPGKNAEFNIKIYFPEYNPGTKLSYFESAHLFYRRPLLYFKSGVSNEKRENAKYKRRAFVKKRGVSNSSLLLILIPASIKYSN